MNYKAEKNKKNYNLKHIELTKVLFIITIIFINHEPDGKLSAGKRDHCDGVQLWAEHRGVSGYLLGISEEHGGKVIH